MNVSVLQYDHQRLIDRKSIQAPYTPPHTHRVEIKDAARHALQPRGGGLVRPQEVGVACVYLCCNDVFSVMIATAVAHGGGRIQ